LLVGRQLDFVLTLHLKAPAILETVSVTSYVSFPGLTSRSAASLARWAAIIASALRPVTWDKHSVTKLKKTTEKVYTNSINNSLFQG